MAFQTPPSPPVDVAGPVSIAPAAASEADVQPTSSTRKAPHTRTGATWFGVCIAAVTLVVLIIFMLQNTRSTEVSFLWMHGSVPLALALLIASVGTALAVMVVGTARITQLRRHARRDERDAAGSAPELPRTMRKAN